MTVNSINQVFGRGSRALWLCAQCMHTGGFVLYSYMCVACVAVGVVYMLVSTDGSEHQHALVLQGAHAQRSHRIS